VKILARTSLCLVVLLGGGGDGVGGKRSRSPEASSPVRRVPENIVDGRTFIFSS
jgi:hypothetical protein